MDLREIGLGVVDWIWLAQDRDRWRAVVSAVMNLQVLAPRSWLVCHERTSSGRTTIYTMRPEVPEAKISKLFLWVVTQWGVVARYQLSGETYFSPTLGMPEDGDSMICIQVQPKQHLQFKPSVFRTAESPYTQLVYGNTDVCYDD
jgi:hypothetical protein